MLGLKLNHVSKRGHRHLFADFSCVHWICGTTASQRFIQDWNILNSMIPLKYMIVLGAIGVCVLAEKECIRSYIRGPINGHHCAGEYFANHTNIKQNECIRICITDSKCWTLSYNVSRQFCQVGKVPCALTDQNDDTFLMVFHSAPPDQETVAPVTWVHYGGNVANVPSRRDDANVDSTTWYNMRRTVARYQDSQGNLHVGYAHFHYVNEPEKPGNSYYVPRLTENEPNRNMT